MRLQMNDSSNASFPTYLGLYWKNLDGYLNNNNVSTHLISVAYGEASVKFGENGLRNITYKTDNETLWDITGLTSINLKLVNSDNPQEPMPLPLAYPVIVEGKIVRMIV